jgi:hypothetical protein
MSSDVLLTVLNVPDKSGGLVTSGGVHHVRRAGHVGDFTRWREHDSYREAFDRLLRDLKAGA